MEKENRYLVCIRQKSIKVYPLSDKYPVEEATVPENTTFFFGIDTRNSMEEIKATLVPQLNKTETTEYNAQVIEIICDKGGTVVNNTLYVTSSQCTVISNQNYTVKRV